VIWIDVHPAEENSINTSRTLLTPVNVHLVYASYGWSSFVATFHESSIEFSWSTTPEKKGFWHNPQRGGWLIRGFVPSFSPEPANKAVGAKPSIYQRSAIRLTGPILQACDRYIQYLLMRVNPSVLNRHRQGLQPLRCWLFIYHSPIFPTSCLPIPPNGPARSLV
jgi:hypothetical protein